MEVIYIYVLRENALINFIIITDINKLIILINILGNYSLKGFIIPHISVLITMLAKTCTRAGHGSVLDKHESTCNQLSGLQPIISPTNKVTKPRIKITT